MWEGIKLLVTIFLTIIATGFGILIIMSSLAFFIKLIFVGMAIGLGFVLVKKIFNR